MHTKLGSSEAGFLSSFDELLQLVDFVLLAYKSIQLLVAQVLEQSAARCGSV